MCADTQLLKQCVVLFAVATMCSLMPTVGLANSAGFSFGDGAVKNADCLKCHNDKQLVGEKNKINGNRFQHTTHGQFGCKTCHNNVASSHPDGKKIARTTICTDCHKDVADQYLLSKHSIEVPGCGSCHNPHAAQKAGEVSAFLLSDTCTSCHDRTRISATHAQWLPQTNLHLGAVTCVTCHTKIDNYVLSVYISHRDLKNTKSRAIIADYDYLRGKAGSDEVQHLVDANRDGYISIEELKGFSRKAENKELYLKAVLIPDKTSHIIKTFDKNFNCTFCHATSPKAQVTKLVVPNKDGSYRQLDVEKGGTLGSLDAIPDFYMMGSSRNSILNKLGVVVLAGGLIMPVGHGFFRFMTRKNRKKE